MPARLYTEGEVAAAIHRERRWFMDWIRDNPTDAEGRPLCAQLGRSRRFTGDDVVRIIDLILTQEEASQPASPDDGCVYFIEGGDLIKIGYSRSLQARLKKMGTDVAGSLRVLLTIPGTFKTEKIIHREFAALRVRGEWFQKGAALLAYIDERRGLCSVDVRP